MSEVVGGGLQAEQHFSGSFVVELASRETVDNHRECLLDGVGIAQWVQHLGARASVDCGAAGPAKLLVVVAEGAGSESW